MSGLLHRLGGLRHGHPPAVSTLCPGSGLAPESSRLICGDGAMCMGCGTPQLLTHDPTGWGGAVIVDHDRGTV